MKKVLIVDDEILVRMGFRSILDWESCGFSVVGDAADGQEALNKIRQLQPDLVFTDLKMERMDGFELMKACAAEYPRIRFIVLSSYNDFDNVRKAMKCGAQDYVFKLDVKPEQLRKILSEIQWEDASGGEKPSSAREERRAALKLALEKSPLAKAEWKRLFPDFDWNSRFRCASIALDTEAGGSEARLMPQDQMPEVETVLSEAMEGQGALCPLSGSEVLLLWPAGDSEALLALQTAYGRAEDYVRRYLGRSTTAVISDEFPSMEALTEALEQNRQTLSCRYLLDAGRIHGYHPLTEPNRLPVPVDLRALEEALRRQEPKQVYEVCAAAFSQMGKHRGYPLPKLRIWMLEMLFSIKRSNPAISAWKSASGASLESMIQTFQKLGEMREAFLQALEESFRERTEKPLRPETEQIVRYAREHLNEEISVSRAAQLTQLSESYFAHIFKRDMGLSFIDWLNRERVEKACALLENTDLRVNEIAIRVGIDNANYFSVLFKKLTGSNPLEIRERKKAGL